MTKIEELQEELFALQKDLFKLLVNNGVDGLYELGEEEKAISLIDNKNGDQQMAIMLYVAVETHKAKINTMLGR